MSVAVGGRRRGTTVSRRALEALPQLGAKNLAPQRDRRASCARSSGLKDEKLKELFCCVVVLLRQFDSYRILHVPREMSKLADRIANRGIDEALK